MSGFSTHAYDDIFADIAKERAQQHLQWGVQRHSFPYWMSIMTEEVGEACEAANKQHQTGLGLKNLVTELIQVAAVCVAILEHIEELRHVDDEPYTNNNANDYPRPPRTGFLG